MNIGLLISELLYENNTVTIPKFGGISTHYKSSEYQSNVGKYAPPSGTISFNPSLIIDDGLLISQVAKSYQLSFTQATKAVNDFVTSIQTSLDKGETVKIEQIGSFRRQGNTIQFSPTENNYNTQAFGLPTISAQPILVENLKEKITFTKPPVQVVTPASSSKILIPKQILQRILLVLGAIGLVTALYFLAQNINFRNSKIGVEKTDVASQDSKESIITAEEPVFLEDITAADTIRRNELSTTNQPTSPKPTAPTAQPREVPKSEKTTSIANTSSGKQIKIVVVGAFDSNENAEKRVLDIAKAGYTPYRFTRNGRRCIGIEYQYQKEEDFVRTLQDIRNKFGKDAWVLTE